MMQSLEKMHRIISALSSQEMTQSQFLIVHEKMNANISSNVISKATTLFNEIDQKQDPPFIRGIKFFNKLKERALLQPDEKEIVEIIQYITLFALEESCLEGHYYIANLRLKGARSFLHPPLNQLSPLSLGGLYAHLLFLMQSLCSSFLYKINGSPFFELGTTLARSNLIIPTNSLKTAMQEAKNLSDSLRNNYPFLSLELHTVPILKTQLQSGDFINKTILSNQIDSDKTEEKSAFVNETNVLPMGYYEQYSGEMLLKHDTSFRLYPTFHSKEPLPIRWQAATREEAEQFRSLIVSNQYLVKDLNEFNKPLSNFTDYSLVRLDVDGYLTSVVNQSTGDFNDTMKYRLHIDRFFKLCIPSYIDEFNRYLISSENILVFLSAADDAVLFCPTRFVQLVSERIQQLYQTYGGKLKSDISEIVEEKTAAETAYNYLREAK